MNGTMGLLNPCNWRQRNALHAYSINISSVVISCLWNCISIFIYEKAPSCRKLLNYDEYLVLWNIQNAWGREAGSFGLTECKNRYGKISFTYPNIEIRSFLQLHITRRKMEEDQEQRYPNNALLFRLAVSNSFKHIAESVSEEKFQETLTILKSKPNVAQKLHRAMIKELYNSMVNDLDDILNDGSLQEGLMKVCKLIESTDTSSYVNAWRPPGNVSLHLRSIDAQKIKEESEKLQKTVSELEDENAILMKGISDKRLKISAIHENIMRSLNRSPMALEGLEKRLEQLEKCSKLLEEREVVCDKNI